MCEDKQSNKYNNGQWLSFLEICRLHGVRPSSYNRQKLHSTEGVQVRKVSIKVGNIKGAWRYEYKIV